MNEAVRRAEIRARERSEAKNFLTDPERLAGLATSDDKYVRQDVADNPNTPPEALSELAADGDDWVRQSVAGNPSTPVEMLTRLADDPESGVRWEVANNPLTLMEVLARLADDREAGVRKRVAGNPSMTTERLEEVERHRGSRLQELISDPGEWVFYRHVEEIEDDRGGFEAEVTSPVAWDTRDWWFDALDLSLAARITGGSAHADVWHDSYPENIGALLPASDGPPDWFEPPAQPGGDEPDDDLWIRHDWRRLVSEEATAEDLAALVEESESVFPGSDLVSAVVARHPSSPDELLSRLAAGDDDQIRWLLTRNPGSSDTVKAAAVLAGVREPEFLWLEDDDEDDEDQDGEVAADGASFSRKIELNWGDPDTDRIYVHSRWAARTVTGADLALFLRDNVLDDEEFKDWADGHRDGDGRISGEDFTEWLKESADDHLSWDLDGRLLWLQEHFNLDVQMRDEDVWDVVTHETDFD